jgi:hypothetical protein
VWLLLEGAGLPLATCGNAPETWEGASFLQYALSSQHKYDFENKKKHWTSGSQFTNYINQFTQFSSPFNGETFFWLKPCFLFPFPSSN